MNGIHEHILEILYSEEDLAAMCQRIAREIERDYAGKEVLLIAVLKGSFVFMADLVRQLNIPCSVEFMAVSSYGNGTSTSGEVCVKKDLDCQIAGRDIIIVEDILDSGVTLSYLKKLLTARGPASIRIATLLDKPERRKTDIYADYVGTVIPNKFIVGYGLDYAEQYRNLPYIGVLKPEYYS